MLVVRDEDIDLLRTTVRGKGIDVTPASIAAILKYQRRDVNKIDYPHPTAESKQLYETPQSSKEKSIQMGSSIVMGSCINPSLQCST